MYPLDWALIVYSIYVHLLISLYLVELFFVFRYINTSFNTSFFRIFGVLAIVNITSCLVGTFVFRLPLYPMVNRIYSGMTQHSSYYLNCLSEFMGVLLALNRFTAL
ncbi:hypothetical protein PMAYCL1PPCAC_33520 [Pristionchus mayeri]|uniref:Uncharacterized protein n=1 Tax=Pristionchus mayeri TaxID=1317129 RepID=A0AAN5C4V0_9BILA|nr:hypothetical protein PMAYCL1PPCAC_00287 [Pristionchus mayeri]GMR63325.1 hypothetical protein PMAYCL1PPCAC_33520 [Pristionchus mayeri]